jgi:hypothetical protein
LLSAVTRLGAPPEQVVTIVSAMSDRAFEPELRTRIRRFLDTSQTASQ